MYQVNLGDSILYYPANADYAIYEAKLEEEVGAAGEFSFKVPPSNPLYGNLSQGSLVTILKDGKEYWRGEIKELSYDFAKVAEVYCLEDLAFLADEFLAPAAILDESYAQRFQAALTAYNLNRTPERQFAIGYISNVQNSDLCNWITEYDMSILGESDPTPEEKLLRAIFGDKAGDVKDASLKASPSLQGVVIGRRLFQRAEKTRSAKMADKAKLPKIDDEFQKKVDDLKEILIEKLLKLVDGRVSQGVKDYLGAEHKRRLW